MISPKRNIPVCFHQEMLHNYDAYFGTWSENVHNTNISDPISVLKELWEFACPVWSLHKNPTPYVDLAKEPLTYIRVPRKFWASTRENLSSEFANNKGADQPAHPRSLISAFVISLLESIISHATRKPVSGDCDNVILKPTD